MESRPCEGASARSHHDAQPEVLNCTGQPSVHRRREARLALACLHDDPQAASLQHQAQLFLDIEAALRSVCSLQVQVAGLRQGALVVIASGALAARLRQQTPSLITHLRARGWAIDGLRFKARPQSQEAPASRSEQGGRKPPALPEKAGACLRSLLAEIHNPGLKASVRGLLRRA